MTEILNIFKNCFFNIYILAPFIFSFLFGIFIFLKNPIITRRLSNTFFLVHFLYTVFIILGIDFRYFRIADVSFLYDRYSGIFIFLSSLIFFMISILSKTFIKKSHRVFYCVLILYLGIINTFILSDNITLSYICIFWLMLLNYLLFNTFSTKDVKKDISYQFIFDIVCLFASGFLAGYDFYRYFVVNEIGFNFSSIEQNLYHIDDFSILLAFIGFLIIIFALFNFIPFSRKNKLNKSNPLIISMQSISSLILGGILFIKCYQNFDYLFYEYRIIIAIYLVVNSLYFAILSLKQDELLKFLSNLMPSMTAIGIFGVFSFEYYSLHSFLYYIISLIVSFAMVYFIFNILSYKFKTNKFEELKKINDPKRLMQFICAFALLNIAKTPVLTVFSSSLICFLSVFSIDWFEGKMECIPYLLILSAFITTYCVYSALYKILIFPSEKSENQTILSSHQINIFVILIFLIILIAAYPCCIPVQINLGVGN